MSPFNTPLTTFSRPAVFDQAEMTKMWTQHGGSSPALPTEKTMNDKRQPKLSMNSMLDEIIRSGKQNKHATSNQEKAATIAAALSDDMDIDDEVIVDAQHQQSHQLERCLDEIINKKGRKQAIYPPKEKSAPSSRPLSPQKASEQPVDMEIDDWSMSNELRMELAKRRAVASLTGTRGRLNNQAKHHKQPSSRSQPHSESKKAGTPPKGPRNTGVQGKKQYHHQNHSSRRAPTPRSHHRSERV